MSHAPAFQPYGLITTRLQEKLYHRAHIANIKTGIAGPKENQTVALMEVIFNQNVFADKTMFIANSQQPPNYTSKRRCDIVISYLDASLDINTLCFAECKRTSTNQPYSLKALEQQAMEYCVLHLEHASTKTFVYAATMAGAHIRLWRYQRNDDHLQALWGSNSVGDWTQYKDVGNELDGRELEWHFGKIKGTTPSARAYQGNSYGDSFSNAALSSSTVAADNVTTSSYQTVGGWGIGDASSSIEKGGYETLKTYYQQLDAPYSLNLATPSSSTGGFLGQLTHGTDLSSNYWSVPSPMVLKSSQLSLLADAIEVQVTYRIVQHKRKSDDYIYRFEYGGERREVPYHDWRGETVLKDGDICPIFAYTGKRTGLTFWTPTLDPNSLTEYQRRGGR